MVFYSQSTRLDDCQIRGPGTECELLIVEGESASKSVLRMRDKQNQAVLPMQGKPMNAWKAGKSAVTRNQLYSALITSLDAGWGEDFKISNVAYRRIIMLFDPDADGIHCSVLMSLFFHRWMPTIIEAGRLLVARPPLFEITVDNLPNSYYARTDQELSIIRKNLQDRGAVNVQQHQFRGLASYNGDFLHETCLNPDTRELQTITAEDITSMLHIFQGETE